MSRVITKKNSFLLNDPKLAKDFFKKTLRLKK